MSREADPARTWDAYCVPQMWDMVKDEDPVPTYQQVGAWQKMAALCTDTADALQKALDQLMVKWPPNPGSAADMFKSRVDQLIWSMRDSAAAATATWPAVIEIVMALSQAKDTIGVLVAKHNAFEKAEDDGVVPTPPTGWRDMLDAQARRIMTVADVKVGDAASQIRSPQPYKLDLRIDTVEPPPPTPPPPGRAESGRARPRIPVVPRPAFDPPAPAIRQDSDHGRDPLEPVLDGGLVLNGQSIDGDRSHSSGADRSFVSTHAGGVAAPGGMIGAPMPGGSSPPASSAGAGRQINNSGTGAGPMMVPPWTARGASDAKAGHAVVNGGRRRRRSDPDDPWAPPSGGPAVLEPAPEPDYFDPGPNVIGIDR